jgi:putative tricarboxylic transport membrane protein
MGALTTSASGEGLPNVKQLEITVGAAPGGGYDLTARAIESVLNTQKLLHDTPIVVTNRPGAGGSVAWAYIQRFKGKPSYISPTAPTIVANDLQNVGGFKLGNVTHLATLVKEDLCFAVNPNAKINSAETLVEALKTKPEAVRFGFSTAIGNQNHIAFALLADSVGVDASKTRTVVFKSSGEANVGLLGGNLDVSVSGLSTFAKYHESNELKCVAIASASRAQAPFDKIPTWRDLGQNFDYASYRGLIAPPDLTAEDITAWEGLLKKMTETDAWKEVARRNLWAPFFLGNKETTEYLAADRAKTERILKQLQLLK